MKRGDFVHQDEPTAMPQRPMPWPTWATALHGPFARRTIAALESNHLRYGGCDDATGERHFDQEEGDKIRPGVGAAGLSFAMVGGASAAAVPTADVAMTRPLEPITSCRLAWKKSPTSAWRRSTYSTRKIPRRPRTARRSHGSRLRWLPRLPWLSRLQGLPRLRWLRRWRLLRVVGSLPLVLSQPAFRLP